MKSLRLLKRLWQALPIADSARWWLTCLLLEPLLPFIKGSVVYTAYLREKEWQARRIRPFHSDPLPKLPPQKMADYIIWGITDWRFRIQRPQHLAHEFAQMGHRVFFISTTFVKTNRPGFELECIDESGRLYCIRLHLNGRPLVSAARPNQADLCNLRASLAKLQEWIESSGIVSLVQHPYWYELARDLPASQLVYDCMDHHAGFSNTGENIAALELDLLKNAEAVVTTSQRLRDIAASHNSHVVLIRNAAEYEFFSIKPNSAFRDPQGRCILGYYGAIAEWMDLELLEKVALSFKDCMLLLVGADERGARKRLATLPNVHFTGEVKYAELPHYLYGMDVCLLPFRITPLTLATNPVKVYEYLASGKPVVSLALPEMNQFSNLVATANSHEEFTRCISEALAESENDQQVRRRIFASQNTWRHRADEFETFLHRLNKSPTP